MTGSFPSCRGGDREPLDGFRDWLVCRSCGRLFHPDAKTCGNYCKAPR